MRSEQTDRCGLRSRTPVPANVKIEQRVVFVAPTICGSGLHRYGIAKNNKKGPALLPARSCFSRPALTERYKSVRCGWRGRARRRRVTARWRGSINVVARWNSEGCDDDDEGNDRRNPRPYRPIGVRECGRGVRVFRFHSDSYLGWRAEGAGWLRSLQQRCVAFKMRALSRSQRYLRGTVATPMRQSRLGRARRY